jgi:hypothetical protein
VGALFSLPAGLFTFLFGWVSYILLTGEELPDKPAFSMLALVAAANAVTDSNPRRAGGEQAALERYEAMGAEFDELDN